MKVIGLGDIGRLHTTLPGGFLLFSSVRFFSLLSAGVTGLICEVTC
jgi:hypothetical protein